MSIRALPVYAAIALLCAAGLLRMRSPAEPPAQPVASPAPAQQAAPLPELRPPPVPRNLFRTRPESTATTGAQQPILLRVECRDGAYRLSAVASSGGIWVVGVQDASGRYHNVCSGQKIPGSNYELRGVEMQTGADGLPKPYAMFRDRVAGRNLSIGLLGRDNADGPECVIYIPGEGERRLGLGSTLCIGAVVWTLDSIQENPPLAVLRGPDGGSLSLNCAPAQESASILHHPQNEGTKQE